jgi:tetratricopeptide (TPR) repeat protein
VSSSARPAIHAYLPKLQTSGGLCYFLRDHLGHPIPSPALFAPMLDRFVGERDRRDLPCAPSPELSAPIPAPAGATIDEFATILCAVAPLCFVLMPFGRKPVSSGATVDFDAVYHDLIAPAIADAGLEALRADQELTGGSIHKPMFERLLLCEFAVADLTAANANVFYELGVRHAVRPASTLLLFAEGTGQLPFDVAMLRALPYRIGPDGKPADASARPAIAARLKEAREAPTDRPIYELVDGFPDLQRLKTDVFRDRVRIREELRARLAAARSKGVDAVRAVAQSIDRVEDEEAGVVIDLLLSYRAVKAWDEMIAIVERMAKPLRRSVLVQEQLGLALNRAGRGEEAERVLREVLDTQGPNSETYGILGRVYKDRWEAAVKTGDRLLARGLIERAIDAYLKGFESDWRDAYPGVNAVTLMELRDPPDARRLALIPIVAYAVERRIAGGAPDYWDHATRLEIAVLGGSEADAAAALADALACVRESWEPETTARNLRLIGEARARRGEALPWTGEIEAALDRRASR